MIIRMNVFYLASLYQFYRAHVYCHFIASEVFSKNSNEMQRPGDILNTKSYFFSF